MNVHNMLEKDGNKYKVGNIKLVRIKPGVIEVFHRGGRIITYRKV